MITVESSVLWDIALLDHVARSLIGSGTYGAGVGEVSSIYTDSVASAGVAQQIFDGYNLLGVSIPSVVQVGDVQQVDGAMFALSRDDWGLLMAGSDSITFSSGGTYNLVWFNQQGLSSHGVVAVV